MHIYGTANLANCRTKVQLLFYRDRCLEVSKFLWLSYWRFRDWKCMQWQIFQMLRHRVGESGERSDLKVSIGSRRILKGVSKVQKY